MKTFFVQTRTRKLFVAFILWSVSATGWAADFTVVASFPTFTINSQSNPGLTVQRGRTYTFSISSGGHPFWIKTVQGNGSGNGYSAGVAANGLQSGTLTLVVQTNAPSTLFYNCEFHGSMTGTITVVDPPPPPVIRILSLSVSNKLALKFTGTNSLAFFPEFNTNLATTNWSALTVQTNFAVNGTNETICGRPPGSNVFIRIRGQ